MALPAVRSPRCAGVRRRAGAGGLAWGAHERNKVWHTEESLWYDVTVNSPRNGRGLMNYGLTQMELGRYEAALDYFNRAAVLNPNYYTLEVNLGM